MSKRKDRVWALWYGGTSYETGDISDDLEMFTSLAAAKHAFTARKKNEGGFTPGVDGTCIMYIYEKKPKSGVGYEPEPDLILTYVGTRLNVARP